MLAALLQDAGYDVQATIKWLEFQAGASARATIVDGGTEVDPATLSDVEIADRLAFAPRSRRGPRRRPRCIDPRSRPVVDPGVYPAAGSRRASGSGITSRVSSSSAALSGRPPAVHEASQAGLGLTKVLQHQSKPCSTFRRPAERATGLALLVCHLPNSIAMPMSHREDGAFFADRPHRLRATGRSGSF
jgi:hypothetical protein